MTSLHKWLTDTSHGEGRAAGKKTTFHIEIQLTSARDHKSRIKFGHEVLAGSEINWKANRPSLQRILNTYKTKYGVEITTSESSSNNEEEDSGNAWQNKVMTAEDGTLFFLWTRMTSFTHAMRIVRNSKPLILSARRVFLFLFSSKR